MLGELLSYYGLAKPPPKGSSGALAEAKDEGVDACAGEANTGDSCIEGDALYGIDGADAEDKRRWVRLHMDLMRTTVADTALQSYGLVAALTSRIPQKSKLVLSSILFGVLAPAVVVFVVVPVVWSLRTLLFDSKDVSARIKLALHGALAFAAFCVAYIVPM